MPQRIPAIFEKSLRDFRKIECNRKIVAGRRPSSDDAALDLLDQIVPDGSVESIRRALDTALTPQSPLNDESASRALAAAEIVAAMMGSPSRHLSASCKEWAARRSRDANRDLTELAVRAVDRVGNDSETQELMQEGEGRSLQDWQASVADLKAQLISR